MGDAKTRDATADDCLGVLSGWLDHLENVVLRDPLIWESRDTVDTLLGAWIRPVRKKPSTVRAHLEGALVPYPVPL